ncbi:bifunctional DNA-formamidopyrimidine glycosylase/DNA-(apurinic or apyrimidinic site) lyase [Oerskovia paurometabola]|uniref:Bifunctional DNA-formamidopyrimidine glycosylase/DNA-(Apurinic or apyrimidinic site) lyase n=1 Tax=Oerskovia paurometabola TaxID=162170 RepID=A0ABW1XGG1_9CELL|nr:bifunctional DNA-formamidopyrimidine glycosylase/DNA-(apurinic or apyrimidinic site) lyase [Oerskovia paurometabola]MBM7496796.1 formamidopyrimidine-DNA glycosylase [Oerskovia paurometabola]
MPELPEVETVRDGLARHVTGRVVTGVEVLRDYSVRRHEGGPESFRGQLVGQHVGAAVRRGKYLWLLLSQAPADATGRSPLPDGAAPTGAHVTALMAHLGMSGQLLVRSGTAAVDKVPHLRVRLELSALPGEPGTPRTLDFVDQRTFGHLSVTDLAPTPDGGPGGWGSALAEIPEPAAHIARDLLDPALRRDDLVKAIRRRRTGIKRALLDQRLVSGVGNIYADEALWRAGLHYARPTDTLRLAEAHRVLDAAEEVMREALAQGGTSFDELYVNVNGQSGYFSRSLAVYGREGEACTRCGALVRRDEFMNRSSYTCPVCQKVPRNARW